MRLLRELLLFLLLLGFWLLLSGRADPLFAGLGVVAAALVTAASAPFFERTIGPASEHPRVNMIRLVPYVVWLLGRMLVSAAQVARIVLDPRVSPEPGVVRFRSELASPAARTVLANSITLVPGTMTLEVEGDEFTVHAFTADAMDDLAAAHMQNRIAAIFRDPHQVTPELIWEAVSEVADSGPADTAPHDHEEGT